jgi:hypothetical protein
MARTPRPTAALALLGLALLVWIEPWLPGRDALVAVLGRDGLLRIAVGVVSVYAALLVLERQRLSALLRELLAERRRSSAVGTHEVDPRDRLEAIRILVGALRSEDAEVRSSAHENLVRICGQDRGREPEAWQSFFDEAAAEGRGS